MKQFLIDYLKGLVISFGIPILLFLAAGLMGGCATQPQVRPYPIEKIQGVEPSILPWWVVK